MLIFGGLFDVENKEQRIDELNHELENPNLWDDKEKAESVIEENNNLKKQITSINRLKEDIDGNLELIKMLEDSYDEEMKNNIEQEMDGLTKGMNDLELEVLLSGEYDSNNAILEVHSGAGGTEACDWANMLFRMYTRWCEKNNYKYEILDTQNGEEAGIKSVSILVKGLHAYGYLKGEKGVHRLIRLSPFDSNNRRHTSFASVEVIPEIDNSIEIDIKEQDLRIDVYHSSGAGGQSVNTSDSAVRITHLPTNIVVTCQNERSQLKNKDKALQILKSKLYQLEEEAKLKSISEIKGSHMSINFGSQIRSYVMHPYAMVKDHRTECETSNVTKVLDGDIDMFIEAYLRGGISSGAPN